MLEKLAHVEDLALLPDLVMVTYEAPGTLETEVVDLESLPSDWCRQEGLTQQRGDAWHRARSAALLRVPSAILPLADSPDQNLIINHDHPAAGSIRIRKLEPFVLDPRPL